MVVLSMLLANSKEEVIIAGDFNGHFDVSLEGNEGQHGGFHFGIWIKGGFWGFMKP